MIGRFQNIRPIFKPLLIIGGVIMAGVLALLFGLFIMLLWNWLMPTIFELPEITYWQAWGIAVLAHLLFKAGAGRHGNDYHSHSKDYFWKRRFKDKIAHSFDESPEEETDAGNGADVENRE